MSSGYPFSAITLNGKQEVERSHRPADAGNKFRVVLALGGDVRQAFNLRCNNFRVGEGIGQNLAGIYTTV